MKKYISLITIVFLIAFSGCDDNLSEEVYSDLTEQDFDWNQKGGLGYFV